MKNLYLIQAQVYFAMMAEYIALQEELLEARQELIELQRRIDEMTPKNVPDEEIFWHISSGMLSTDAAKSDNPVILRQFREWNTQFAKRHIKPYVNPKVYGECLNQMTRGLAERIAELETEQQPVKPASRYDNKIVKPKQPILIS